MRECAVTTPDGKGKHELTSEETSLRKEGGKLAAVLRPPPTTTALSRSPFSASVCGSCLSPSRYVCLIGFYLLLSKLPPDFFFILHAVTTISSLAL